MKSCLLRVFIIYLCFCIPWNRDGLVFRRLRHCSRPKAWIVRQLVNKLWKPVFKKYNLNLSEQCPFHISRDVFASQELSKIYFRNNLWMCSKCGKVFQDHISLDMHIASKHGSLLREDETNVCVAEFCDVFNCQSYLPDEAANLTNEALMSRTANVSQHALHYPDFGLPEVVTSTHLIEAPPESVLELFRIQGKEREIYDKLKRIETGESWATTRTRSLFQSLFDTQDQPRRKDTRKRSLSEGYRWMVNGLSETSKSMWAKAAASILSSKESCSPTDMFFIKRKCEVVLNHCVNDHLAHLDEQTFAEFKNNLHQTSCWFLDCDRLHLIPNHSLKPRTGSSKSRNIEVNLRTLLTLFALLIGLVAAIIICIWILF